MDAAWPTNSELSQEQLSRMRFLRNCIREVVRLRSSFMLVRQVLKPNLEIECAASAAGEGGGRSKNPQRYTVPEGTCFLSPYLTHQNARIYADPERFDPDRFDPPRNEGGSSSSFEWLGFGAGRHICQGEEFGYLESQVIACMLLRYTRVRRVQPPPSTKLPQTQNLSQIPATNFRSFGIQKPLEQVFVEIIQKNQ